VPRVVDLSEAEAIKKLTKLGLIADVQRTPVDQKSLDGIVVGQVPIGDGTKLVDAGATITIVVGEFTPGNGNGDGGGGGGGGPSPSPPPEGILPQAR